MLINQNLFWNYQTIARKDSFFFICLKPAVPWLYNYLSAESYDGHHGDDAMAEQKWTYKWIIIRVIT